MGKTLYDKVFDRHAVRPLPSGQVQLFMDVHLVHELTSPQAFGMLRERGLSVAYPERTFATCDHVIPTASRARPFADRDAEELLVALEKTARATASATSRPRRANRGSFTWSALSSASRSPA
jgi:3-isopropylmalate/(R)-2-methylmalate dehydratase large subunit